MNSNDIINGGDGYFENLFIDGVDVHEVVGLPGPKGDKGDPGTGDVVGPSGGVVNNEVALYNSTTGKGIKGSGILSSALATLTDSQTLTNKTLTAPILTLEQGTSVAPTAEGRIAWDTDDNTLKVGDGTGTQTFLPDRNPRLINVRDYGVKGDGTLETMSNIEAARDALVALGGGKLYFPAGTYLLQEGSSANVAIEITTDNIHICGDGPGATILKLDDGQDSMVISINAASGDISGSIRGVEIDGNGANQSIDVHGIRLDSIDGYEISDFYIHNTAHYGIGCQDGTIRNLRIHDGTIEDVEGDGIDFKNRDHDNAEIYISDVTIRRWGSGTTVQAGIDCRGPIHITRVAISEPAGATCIGVRFRAGELVDANGYGAHGSSLSQFTIDMGSQASASAVFINARDVVVVNGHAAGGQRGILIQEVRAKVSDVTVTGSAETAFFADENTIGGTYQADYATLVNCTAVSNTDNGFRIEADNVSLVGCTSTGNDDGVVITSDADGTRILGGYFAGNTTSQISDSGTNTQRIGAAGLASLFGQNIITPGVGTAQVSINDDSVYDFGNLSPSSSTTLLLVSNSNGDYGFYRIRTTSSPLCVATNMGLFTNSAVSTADVSGTTGADAKFTVSATNGHLKIENRLGAAITFAVLVIRGS